MDFYNRVRSGRVLNNCNNGMTPGVRLGRRVHLSCRVRLGRRVHLGCHVRLGRRVHLGCHVRLGRLCCGSLSDCCPYVGLDLRPPAWLSLLLVARWWMTANQSF